MTVDRMAVVIRSAPGDPTERIRPSSWRAMVGAILEVSRVPGARAWKPRRLSSISPRQLFIQIPVPGGMTPEPYPEEMVTEQAAPVESTVEVCTVDGDLDMAAMSPVSALVSNLRASRERSSLSSS